MRYFIDTEFNAPGAGKPIELISIGVVGETGCEFYRENEDALSLDVSPWIRENVFPYLLQSAPDFDPFDITNVRSLRAISGDLRLFIGDDTEPEFWGYYCAYDYVVLSQLMGGMDDWPDGWPFIMYDLRQSLDERGWQGIRQPDDAPHRAMDDARWIRDAFVHQHQRLISHRVEVT